MNRLLRPAGLIILVISATILGFIGWSLWAELDQVARAPGRVVPFARVQVVQSEQDGAIAIGTLVIVPTAYWVRLKVPRLRPLMEFISLLPLIVPPVVLVFGYIRMFGSSSVLPLTASTFGTDILLVLGYVVLSMPYMYRAIDNGLSVIDIATLTEAAESLGASRFRTIVLVIFPNVRAAIISGAFLTFSISLGEFVLASLLNRPAFGPYLVQLGQDRAYEPAALAIMSFAFTWGCMALMQLFAIRKPGQRWFSRSTPRTATGSSA